MIQQSPAALDRPDNVPGRWHRRAVAMVLLGGSLGVLIVAASLDPHPAGLGTHTRLGLPPCGMVRYFGSPCMTCGMTTAFAHAADGNLLASFRTQPAGALLSILTAAAALISGYAVIVGVSLVPLAQRVLRPRWIWIIGLIVLLSWGYKILLFKGMF